MSQNIVVRFAPSPTGFLHIGGARTALFNYLFARSQGSKFILRIEDTDRERSTSEFEKSILETIEWLGFEYDGELLRQSERTSVYKVAIEKLIKEGKAFVSKETPKEEGDRSEVIRFKNPNKKIVFNDLIRGEISFDTTELGDFVIAKSLEEPVFHLANVVDDADSGVTHVIRGEDHISNTPRQILIFEALGFPRPIYGHIPLILAKDRSKLSKRHGAVSVTEYRDNGYLSEALINYLALLGWNPGTDQEIFSKEDLIKTFSIDKVQKGGAVFDPEKLRWINREHLLRLPEETKFASVKAKIIKKWKVSDEKIMTVLPLILERIHTWGDVRSMIALGELDFFFEEPKYEKNSLLWKGDTDTNKTKARLEKVLDLVGNIPEEKFNKDEVKNSVWDFAEKEGRGSVLWPLRFSLSGKEKSPDPFTLAGVLGKKETLSRVKNAIAKLS